MTVCFFVGALCTGASLALYYQIGSIQMKERFEIFSQGSSVCSIVWAAFIKQQRWEIFNQWPVGVRKALLVPVAQSVEPVESRAWQTDWWVLPPLGGLWLMKPNTSSSGVMEWKNIQQTVELCHPCAVLTNNNHVWYVFVHKISWLFHGYSWKYV